MIQPLHTTQLSSAKPRSGLQSIADLLPRLIQQYEMQAELAGKQSQTHSQGCEAPIQQGTATQVTFSWYR